MKAQLKTGLCFAAMCLVFGLSASNVQAFSLLGPFESWMEETNGLRQPSDIGGPMDITNEYRWNVPVVTYGFDQSFLDYFGSNGVAAVSNAIQILNNLPPASQTTPASYPFNSQNYNLTAQTENLYDLKSETLSLLLEQMGLAQPTRYIFVLRQWSPQFIPLSPNAFTGELDWESWAYPDFIAQRNFDPMTFESSHYVNGTLYTAYLVTEGNQNFIETTPVDPFAAIDTAVADNTLSAGGFFTGLTEDDVGGLCYLLSTNNVNYETLLPGVSGVGVNSNSFVNGAWRPGIDKITFVPQPVNSQSGAFLPTTNYFTDSYITNGVLKQQQMARAISQPDFLFCAGDVDANSKEPSISFGSRTGTTNWINNAALNGNQTEAGPGIIQPQIQIAFNKLGLQFDGGGNIPDDAPLTYESIRQSFGSFDSSTNVPIIYPAPQSGTNQFTVRMWLEMGTPPSWSTTSFKWKPTSAPGAQFLFQTSTNLTDWITLATNSNDGSVTTYFLNNPKSPTRFYRLVPQ